MVTKDVIFAATGVTDGSILRGQNGMEIYWKPKQY